MTTPQRPEWTASRRDWPRNMIVLGALVLAAGAFFYIGQAWNAAICQGGVAAAAGNTCNVAVVKHAAGGVGVLAGLTLILCGVVGVAGEMRR